MVKCDKCEKNLCTSIVNFGECPSSNIDISICHGNCDTFGVTTTTEEEETRMLLMDGYDSCIIGTALTWDSSGSRTEVAVYDAFKIATVMMNGGCSYEDAVDYIEFNMVGSYVGRATPIIVWPASAEQIHALYDDVKYDTEK